MRGLFGRSCFGRAGSGSEISCTGREGGSCPGELPVGAGLNHSQICFVPQADALDRFSVARSGTGSGCCRNLGIWEEGFLKEAPEGFAAGTKAKFGLSSCCCDECDF